MKTTEIIVKATGEEKTAVYAPNSSGNMRYNVDGKFYTDKQFNKLFDIACDRLVWRSHVRQLFDEILSNQNMWIFYQPLRITISILGEMAEYAAQMNDEKMIGYFARLSLYQFSDPTHKDFDEERTEYYINKTK